MTLVSVIVPCFSAADWIRDALNSVAAQEVAGVEIIVVDDGSTNDSAAIIAEEFEHVRLIQTRNCGPGAARNTGTVNSLREFIQYLDAEDILAPDKLGAQLELIQQTEAMSCTAAGANGSREGTESMGQGRRWNGR